MLEEIKTPWSSIGPIVYKRTYSRPMKGKDNKGRTEDWPDTVARVVTACDTQLHCGFTEQENTRLMEYMLGLKATVGGRFLWQLGTPTVDKLGLASLQNCWMINVDSPEAFTFAFDLLMLGGGVGFNIQKFYVDELPPVVSGFAAPTRADGKDAGFIVPDTREGWVELLRHVLNHAFGDGVGDRKTFTYSTHLVRGKGDLIKGFGGVASGPDPLIRGIEQISGILAGRAGSRLSTVDCLDIMNIIGTIVVSGNVRRSAQIALGDYHDIPFLMAKRWDLGDIPSWRDMSNNSVICDDIRELPPEFWEGYKGNGEPYGLVNLRLARNVGRLEDVLYADPLVSGVNPLIASGLVE